MDFTNWRTLERFAAAIRPVPNRAPAVPKLGEVRRDGTSAAHAGATPPGRWRFGFERVLCGRAKKGGDSLGKPSGARAPRSWALQTAMVFLSPCGQKALRRLK